MGAENSYSSHLSGKRSSIEPSDLANYRDLLSEVWLSLKTWEWEMGRPP